ncbi:MAG: rhodanese-like domain-containing protein [Holophagaceae bacterium]
MPPPSAKPGATLLRMLALAGLAVLAALLSNTLQPPSRRLSWTGFSLPGQAAPPSSEAPVPPPPPRAEAPKPAAPAPPRPVLPPNSMGTRAEVPASPAPAGPIREIGSQEAWKAFQGGLPFLDARRSEDYTAGHVAGAWCTPVWEADLGDRLLAFKASRRPGPEDPIVIYCSGGDCRDSHLLAERLLSEGYFHLLIYRDGFPDWMAAGRPVEKGQP